jgi:hypothetical protein
MPVAPSICSRSCSDTAELSADHMPVILKKPFQQLPLSGGADNFLFGESRV